MAIKRLSSDERGDGTLVNLGYVGIGTITPAYTLDVSGTARVSSGMAIGTTVDNDVPLKIGTTSTVGQIGLHLATATGSHIQLTDTGNVDMSLGVLDGQSALSFHTGRNRLSAGTELMRLTSAGNVGIGTSSPGSQLDVVAQDAFRITGYQPFLTVRDSNSSNRGFRLQTAAGDILFETDASGGGTYAEKMRLSAAGNVGIGTTGPLSTLHLATSGGAVLRVTTDTGGGGANSSILMGNQDSGGANKPYILRSLNAALYMGTGDSWSSTTGGTLTTRMMIDSSGNVGIGTSSPTSTLHVVAPNTSDIEARFTGGNTQGIAIQNGTLWEYRVDADTGEIAFNYTGYNSGITRFRNTVVYNGKYGQIAMFQGSTGRLGIGTSSPQANLHVTSGGFNVGYFTNGTFASASNSTLLIGGGDAGLGGWENVFLAIHKSGSTAGVGSSSSLSRIRFDATSVMMTKDNGSSVLWAGSSGAYSGNVGIGTSSPGYSLDVVAGANLAARFRGAAGQHTVVTLDSASDSYAPYLLFQRNGADKWLLQAWTDNNFYVLDDDLNNGVYIAQDTTSWAANSDARLKDVIGPIENATAKVNALSGVRYTWKRDADKSLAKVRVGLIAQDVFDVLPESVEAENPDIITDEVTGKVSGGLGVRYTELVPLLVNAIKELTTRITTLEQRA